MMLIDNKYNIGDVVYLKTDPDVRPRMVTAMQIDSQGLMYQLNYGTEKTFHYDIEITKEKSFVEEK